jgi:hypothetical protein
MSLSSLFLPMLSLIFALFFRQTIVSDIAHFAIFGINVKICCTVDEFGVAFGITG